MQNSGFRRAPAIALSCAFAAVLLLGTKAEAAVLVSADGPGNTYELLQAQGMGLELPDCGHAVRHIREVFDNTLGKNVFAFDIHRDQDDDRCNGSTDRQRLEIKTAPGNANQSTMQHTNGQTAYYRWKFRLDSGFRPSSSFTHIFQIKAQSGGDEGSPLITITPRAGSPEQLQIIFTAPSGGSGSGTKAQVPLSSFKGVWVEAFVQYRSADAGSVHVSIRRMSDAATLLSWTSGTLDMWRSGNNYNRGKWGLYRSLNQISVLRDETALFADWCISETSASECPSQAGGGNPTPTSTPTPTPDPTPTPSPTPTPGPTASPTPTPTSTPTPAGDFNGYYQIVARHSGKAVTVQGASTAENAAVVQFPYGGAATNDEWSLISVGSGYYRVMNRNSGKAMAVRGASTSSSTPIVQLTYGGSATNDEWAVQDLGTGYFRFLNRNSGKALDVKAGSTADGAILQQSTPSGVNQQQYQIVSVP
jgi:hypothetical protein